MLLFNCFVTAVPLRPIFFPAPPRRFTMYSIFAFQLILASLASNVSLALSCLTAASILCISSSNDFGTISTSCACVPSRFVSWYSSESFCPYAIPLSKTFFLVLLAASALTPQSTSICSHAPPSRPLYAYLRCSRQCFILIRSTLANESSCLCSASSSSPSSSLICSTVPRSSTSPSSPSIHSAPATAACPSVSQAHSSSVPTSSA